MAPPSQLAISTQAVSRLVKEEQSYHKELLSQEEKIRELEADLAEGKDDEDGNGKFILEQNRRAKQETLDIFAPLGEKLRGAVAALESQLESVEKGDEGDDGLAKARETLAKAREILTDADNEAPKKNGTK